MMEQQTDWVKSLDRNELQSLFDSYFSNEPPEIKRKALPAKTVVGRRTGPIMTFDALPKLDRGMTIEQSGRFIAGYTTPAFKFKGSSGKDLNFWDAVKEEIKILICSKDKKYAELRKLLSSKEINSSSAMVVAAIAIAIAGLFGISAMSLTPIVALILFALAKVGKEAFCRAVEFDTPIATPVRKSNKRKKGPRADSTR
jgi:hypothetical protein